MNVVFKSRKRDACLVRSVFLKGATETVPADMLLPKKPAIVLGLKLAGARSEVPSAPFSRPGCQPLNPTWSSQEKDEHQGPAGFVSICSL